MIYADIFAKQWDMLECGRVWTQLARSTAHLGCARHAGEEDAVVCLRRRRQLLDEADSRVRRQAAEVGFVGRLHHNVPREGSNGIMRRLVVPMRRG